MLKRIDELLCKNNSFAFETTLSSKAYKHLIIKAQQLGYKVTLLFFWLQNAELAKLRVNIRVFEGGHNIPTDVIERRYIRGINNLFQIYLPIVDTSLIYDNSNGTHKLIGEYKNKDELSNIDNCFINKLKNNLC